MSPERPQVVFERIFPDVELPQRQTGRSAGYDIRAHVAGRDVKVRGRSGILEERRVSGGVLEIAPGETALVPTGFRASLPDGYEAQIRVRSSIAFKRGLVLPNAPGTIDADYPDEWLVMMMNTGGTAARIEHGERIAQVILARYETADWIPGQVGRSTGRAGGLGSTGTR